MINFNLNDDQQRGFQLAQVILSLQDAGGFKKFGDGVWNTRLNAEGNTEVFIENTDTVICTFDASKDADEMACFLHSATKGYEFIVSYIRWLEDKLEEVTKQAGLWDVND